MLRSIILALTLMLLGGPLLAETRVALVIGASRYGHDNDLASPEQDIRMVSGALHRSGFAVTKVVDPNAAAFRAALEGFRKQADAADVAIVYFAGHGIEIDDTNWLLPVSATGRSAQGLPAEAIRAAEVMNAVRGAKKVRLVVIDACRDNPYAPTPVSFADQKADPVVVLLSTQAGATAADGFEMSPFAVAFANLVGEPGLRLATLARRLAHDVNAYTGAYTGHEQRPEQRGMFDKPDWMFVPPNRAAPVQISAYVPVTIRGELTRQFVPLQPAQPAAAPKPKPKPASPAPRPKPSPPPPPPPDPEIAAWGLCVRGTEIPPCDAYLAEYPTGKWADLARQRKTVLEAALAPVPAAAPIGDKKMEKANWQSCKDGKVFGACEFYLRSYPKGRWTRDAEARVRAANAAITEQRAAQKEKAEWDNCASNSLAGLCERFLTSYPKSTRADAARERIAKLNLGASRK